MTARRTFRSMGTDVTVVGPAGSAFGRATAAVERRFALEDRRCSRFRRDSELSRLNAAAGRPVRVSRELASAVALALDAAARTDGRVDPTVLGALIAAGYDRDFDELLAGARDALRPSVACGRWGEVGLNGDLVRLPAGVGLDLGGIAKGATVDVAVSEALAAGLRWVLVNAGGDLRLAGSPPPLDVAVEDPEAGGELLRLHLRGGALATSTVSKRAWGSGLHHLIDPRTGAPAATDVVQATAWAPTCAAAEVLAKDLVLRGTAAARDPIAVGASAVLVTRRGEVLVAAAAEAAA